MNESLSAYQISKKLFNLWMQHVEKHSGEIEKLDADIPLYVENESDGISEAFDVTFEPDLGIVIHTR